MVPAPPPFSRKEKSKTTADKSGTKKDNRNIKNSGKEADPRKEASVNGTERKPSKKENQTKTKVQKWREKPPKHKQKFIKPKNRRHPRDPTYAREESGESAVT